MNIGKKFPFPLSLVIVDLIGAVLIGLGLVEKFGSMRVIPQAYRFQDYDVVLIVTGIVLSLPFYVWKRKKLKHLKSEAENIKAQATDDTPRDI